jgi:hypothetical protein
MSGLVDLSRVDLSRVDLSRLPPQWLRQAPDVPQVQAAVIGARAEPDLESLLSL